MKTKKELKKILNNFQNKNIHIYNENNPSEYYSLMEFIEFINDKSQYLRESDDYFTQTTFHKVFMDNLLFCIDHIVVETDGYLSHGDLKIN